MGNFTSRSIRERGKAKKGGRMEIRGGGVYYLPEIRDSSHFLSQKKSPSVNTIDV